MKTKVGALFVTVKIYLLIIWTDSPILKGFHKEMHLPQCILIVIKVLECKTNITLNVFDILCSLLCSVSFSVVDVCPSGENFF